MISIRKYLDAKPVETIKAAPARLSPSERNLLLASIEAYRGVLIAISGASINACPALLPSLDGALTPIAEELASNFEAGRMAPADAAVTAAIATWGRNTARYYQKKATEVKEILLAMARTAGAVGERDLRCAQQLSEVTTSLKSIASLDDISQIRSSVEKSVSHLQGSIERMAAEGKAVLDRLNAQVSDFEVKLAEAEQIASRDALTRLGSRLWIEAQLEQRIAAGQSFCVALIDLDRFKKINDNHGHLAGDDVLRQFAAELRSACRSTDMVGRWGGDEFLVLLDCPFTLAQAQMERVAKWVCGSYAVHRDGKTVQLPVRASIGLSQFVPPQTMEQLLDHADASMYSDKHASGPEDIRRGR